MDKAKLNYWLDVAIAVAFLLSAISGLVFLLPVGLGSGSVILGLSYQVWDALHIRSSLAMIAGVLVHLVLHRKWIVSMTRRMLQKSPRMPLPENTESVPQVVWIDNRGGHRHPPMTTKPKICPNPPNPGPPPYFSKSETHL